MEDWRSYDVESLRRNIQRIEGEIETFKAIVDRSVKEGRLDQAVLFTRAVERAEVDKAQLEEYVRLIEDGRTV